MAADKVIENATLVGDFINQPLTNSPIYNISMDAFKDLKDIWKMAADKVIENATLVGDFITSSISKIKPGFENISSFFKDISDDFKNLNFKDFMGIMQQMFIDSTRDIIEKISSAAPVKYSKEVFQDLIEYFKQMQMPNIKEWKDIFTEGFKNAFKRIGDIPYFDKLGKKFDTMTSAIKSWKDSASDWFKSLKEFSLKDYTKRKATEFMGKIPGVNYTKEKFTSVKEKILSVKNVGSNLVNRVKNFGSADASQKALEKETDKDNEIQRQKKMTSDLKLLSERGKNPRKGIFVTLTDKTVSTLSNKKHAGLSSAGLQGEGEGTFMDGVASLFFGQKAWGLLSKYKGFLLKGAKGLMKGGLLGGGLFVARMLGLDELLGIKEGDFGDKLLSAIGYGLMALPFGGPIAAGLSTAAILAYYYKDEIADKWNDVTSSFGNFIDDINPFSDNDKPVTPAEQQEQMKEALKEKFEEQHSEFFHWTGDDGDYIEENGKLIFKHDNGTKYNVRTGKPIYERVIPINPNKKSGIISDNKNIGSFEGIINTESKYPEGPLGNYKEINKRLEEAQKRQSDEHKTKFKQTYSNFFHWYGNDGYFTRDNHGNEIFKHENGTIYNLTTMKPVEPEKALNLKPTQKTVITTNVKNIDKTDIKSVSSFIKKKTEEVLKATNDDNGIIDTPDEMEALLRAIAIDQQSVGKLSIKQRSALVEQISSLVQTANTGNAMTVNLLDNLLQEVKRGAALGSNIVLGGK